MTKKNKTGAMRWYQRDPQAFHTATIGWDEGLKGAYSTIIDLLYMTRGRLPDEAAYISVHIGCSKNKWTGTYRKQLLEREKIVLNDGYFTNSKATEVIIDAGYEVAEIKTSPKHSENIRKTLAKSGDVLPNFDSKSSTFKGDIVLPEEKRREENKDNPNGLCKSDTKKHVDEVVTAYGKLAANYAQPKIAKLTPARRKLIEARLKDADGNPEQILTVLRKVAKSSFCQGHGETGWVAGFDFIFKPASYLKILEGNYDDKTNSNRSGKNSNAGGNRSGAKGFGSTIERWAEEERQEFDDGLIDITPSAGRTGGAGRGSIGGSVEENGSGDVRRLGGAGLDDAG